MKPYIFKLGLAARTRAIISLRKYFRASAVSFVALYAAGLMLSPHAASQESNNIEVKTLSSQPDRVSGGNALIEIFSPGLDPKRIIVKLNDSDVTGDFHPGSNPGTLLGLVDGLKLGRNQLKVSGPGSSGGSLELTDYPIKGPIFSGPQIKPFICQTDTFKLPDANVLGPPIDADCSAATRINYVYMSTATKKFTPLPSTTNLPSDVATTTISAGVAVPYIVRVETGTMNRGIYQNAILFNPLSDTTPTPFSPPKGWNHRLIGIHGAGCPGGWYTQGSREGVDILQDMYLSQGYALFINSLQNPSNSCNTFVAGESALMGKEHFIKTFGVPDFTLSTGGSGGAYTSLGLADAFPGLFDGAFVNLVFPDATVIALSGLDAHLLTHYFTATNPNGFTMDQQVAVSGYKGQQAWYDAANQAQRTDAVPDRPDVKGYESGRWNDVVPKELRYDPKTNPKGARPTIWDVSRATYGVDPKTGFALRTYDNVGVQYGLAALNSGIITNAQFLDLNAKIGGLDRDDNYIPTRTIGDESALKTSYEVGTNLGGNGALASVPVIDFGSYNETSGYHYQWYRFAVRQRLIQMNGNADNYIMWRGNNATKIPLQNAFTVMAQWVAAIKADHAPGSAHDKTLRNRPATAMDGCYDTSPQPQFVAERQTFGNQPDSKCNTLFPSWGNPRLVAGGPLAGNNLKCQMKPISSADYKVSFTAEETAELARIFPQGVCDWSKTGVNFHGVVVGKSLGPAPSEGQAGFTD